MITALLLTDATSSLGACRARGIRLATAESCTGGLIIATLNAMTASSDVVHRGYAIYANAAKHDVLGVPMEPIARPGCQR
jgi:nicotinamide-nucleotide amidase